MGFSVKIIVLFRDVLDVDTKGPNGEDTCVYWYATRLAIDFGPITRLEKVVGDRFAHLKHSPIERAGICAVDGLLRELYRELNEKPRQRLAPEFLVRRGIFNDDISEETKMVGGSTYVDCHELYLDTDGGLKQGKELIATHNKVLQMEEQELKAYVEKHDLFFDGPLVWASCVDLAVWLQEAEEKRTQGWEALVKDPVARAIVQGWRHQLRELGEVGAYGLFRFS